MNRGSKPGEAATMPRPPKRRLVQARPVVAYYEPLGVPLAGLGELILPVEGLEALRLADAEGLDHQTAASMMGVSRPTFSRLLASARRIVARALERGLALRIEGGSFSLAQRPALGGPGRGHGRGGPGRGRRGGVG